MQQKYVHSLNMFGFVSSAELQTEETNNVMDEIPSQPLEVRLLSSLWHGEQTVLL